MAVDASYQVNAEVLALPVLAGPSVAAPDAGDTGHLAFEGSVVVFSEADWLLFSVGELVGGGKPGCLAEFCFNVVFNLLLGLAGELVC